MRGPTRPPQPSDRGARGETAIEQAQAQFQECLRALEHECQIFRSNSGWKDESQQARAREWHRQLRTLERTLGADRSLGQPLAFQQRNLLL